ncbi:MAG: putative glycoside hydrolase, partial [Acidimicrobiia bacterium]
MAHLQISQNPGFALSLSSVSRRTGFRLLVAFTLIWGSWAVWAVAGGTAPVTVNVIDDVGDPVSRAQVSSGGVVLGVTDNDGSATVEWHGGLSSFAVQASGYNMLQISVLDKPDTSVEAVLRPSLLRGRIVDPDERPVEGAYVTAGAGTAVTDLDGRFSVRKAERGPVQVWRPAWEGSNFDWNGNPGEESVTIRPETMKAVHIGGEAAEKGWSTFVQMAADTELNALMLDLKDESGVIGWDAPVPFARQIGAVDPIYDLEAAVELLHARGVRVVGRLVAFRDPILAGWAWSHKRRAMVTQTPTGKRYAGYGGFTNFA